jgi:hypothetical protein
MTPEMFSQTVSELAGWLVILSTVTLATCVLLRRDKVRRDRAERGVQS